MALPSEDGSCHVRSSISDDAMTIAIDQSCPQFDIASVKPLQCLALSQLVRGNDVLACLPTEFGKSLIFTCYPASAGFCDRPYCSRRGAVAVFDERPGCVPDRVRCSCFYARC